MLEGLDSIPWAKITHAYGSAEDVPELLRALASTPPDGGEEEGPLWELYGNIWHQGTVYEATAYAVPFLIELIANPRAPEREGILQLLAAIATGSSYLAVHGNVLNKPDFEEKKARELVWVAKAHAAVAAGIKTFLALTKEKGEVRLAAAHVLALLPEHAEIVRPLLHQMLHTETDPLYQAGLLLLMGQSGDQSRETLSILLATLERPDETLRRAAIMAISWLKPRPLPGIARDAILDTLMVDDFEESFQGLPWDVEADANSYALLAGLDEPARNEAAERLVVAIDSGATTDARVWTLLEILFPRLENGLVKPLTARDLSPVQARAVRAMARAMEGGNRIFHGHFPQWGLPDTNREWRNLAAGHESVPVDMTLPILADPGNPTRPLRSGRLKQGQRVLHRTFGLGTVTETESAGRHKYIHVDFDDEGTKTLMLP